MFASTVIPTVGRPTLSRAVESVLDQEMAADDFEVIVVNDSGSPLPEMPWRGSERVRIIDTNRRERSVARNTGAAVATGQYLHFLDDDDWLAPGAFRSFWDLSRSSNAVWLYGVSQLVDRQMKPLVHLRHGLHGNCFTQVMAGEWIPLQASLVEARAFFTVGGFHPTITGPEDIDLLRRIALIGDVAETPNLVAYVVRGDCGSTTDYARHPEASRWAREAILDGPGVFGRLLTSANSSFWHGRIVRLYLTSSLWNVKRSRFLKAAGRAALALGGLVAAGPSVMSRDFWRAVAGPYASQTFADGFRAARNPSNSQLA